MQVTIEPNPAEEDVERINDGLAAYNAQFTDMDGFQRLTIFVRDESGDIKGGLLGVTFWQWCHIAIVWLDESIRRGGYGSQMLKLAEQEALARGCIGVFLDTISFQAPDFYRKHGYTQWGQLDDCPPGHSRLFFKKWLVKPVS